MKRKYRTGNAKFDFAIAALSNHIAISGKSVSTQNHYTPVVYDLIVSLNKLPEECTKIEIVNYLMACKNEKNLQYAGLKGYIYAVKYYLKNIAERMDLYEKIPNPIIKQYNIEVLTVQEIKLLFANCKNSRELLIIQLLYETGIRVSELIKRVQP